MTPPPVAGVAPPLDAQPACLAFGAWLKNRICLVGDPARLGGDGVRWSALHGDLGDPGACAALEASAEALLAAAEAEGIEIGVVAHDLHPDFFSSQLAVRIADRLGVPAVPVQHHHAHIAAALAEHRHAGPAIGLALDGVGLGTDGGAWGGELLLVEADDWLRLGALQPLALPGGDIAAREPWRMAAALLHALGLDRQIEFRLAPRVGETAARTVAAMLARNLNCPTATGAGRWFDAIAGLLALSDRQTEEAEAAIALETAARLHLEAGGAALAGFTIPDGWLLAEDPPHADAPGFTALDLRPFALALLDGLDATGRDDASVGHWAAAFHATLSAGLADWAIAAARAQDVRTVALSGGCFFNRLLRVDLGARLAAAGLEVIDSARAGLGDSGLALGQAWVARQALACRDVLPGDAF
ncbi:hypothetical protein [Derxia gummosa]|uniref:Hydrogenase maturation protein HypF n=1 Tax=Derxia gummosa DSM 723 TaxID=1121388 RepID=A0A8B6X8N7_9BURK|nr:hypothetical protein [Derxia gummosa]